MSTTTREVSRPSRPLAAAALLGACIIAAAAVNTGARPLPVAAAPEPTRIGLVDIGALMNGLTELKTRNEEVQIKGKALQENLAALNNEIKSIEAELKDKDILPQTDTKRRIEKLARLVELKATLEARGKAYQQMINLENGDILADLYAKVQTAADAFAKREGYDLILIDDRAIRVMQNLTDRECNEIIQSKRVIYARSGIEITEQLKTMMNNEYAAGLNRSGN